SRFSVKRDMVVPEKIRRRGISPAPSGWKRSCEARLVAAVAGGLHLVEPIGRALEVEVQLLLLEVGAAVLEADLAGRILRLRGHALAGDARSRARARRGGLRRQAGGEVRALRTI